MGKPWRARTDLSSERLCDLYAEGHSITDIAAAVGAAPWTVHQRLRASGVDTSQQRTPLPIPIEEAVRRYNAGASMRQLAADIGTTAEVLKARLSEHGVRIRTQYEDARASVMCGVAWMKRCRGCWRPLPPSAFHRNPPGIMGLKSRCIRCERDRIIRHNYGVSLATVEAILAAQGGGCAICRLPLQILGEGPAARIDHCHTTRTIRGILCHPCNVAIGLLQDSPARLRSAIRYLAQTTLDLVPRPDPHSREGAPDQKRLRGRQRARSGTGAQAGEQTCASQGRRSD